MTHPDSPLPHGFMDLARARRSCRAYAVTRPVSRDLISHCLHAARWAPSACNRQPWRFVVVDEPETCQALRERARLPGIAHTWWDTVPVFVALCADLDLLTHHVAPVISKIPYYMLDIGIAGEHFVLAAAELGLGTCWIGWFRESAAKKVLNIPRRVRVLALITLGYPAAPSPAAPTCRRELPDLVHWNRWD